MRLVPLALGLVLLAACAPAVAPASPTPPSTGIAGIVLRALDGTAVPFDDALQKHPVTVVSFFSASCPCQRAHDARIKALAALEASRDVGFLVVDPERKTTPDEDAAEAHSRGYPILRDPAGALAARLGAEYATFSVVLDRAGRVLYRGGIDSDKTHLRDDATPFLANAVDDALAGRPVREPSTKSFGCVLETE